METCSTEFLLRYGPVDVDITLYAFRQFPNFHLEFAYRLPSIFWFSVLSLVQQHVVHYAN